MRKKEKKMFREINEVDYRVKHAQTSGSIWALYPVHIKTIFYKAISLLYISPSLKKRGENIISNKQIMYISFKPNHADQAPIPSEYALYQYLGLGQEFIMPQPALDHSSEYGLCSLLESTFQQN
jgi:hypothetical protein